MNRDAYITKTSSFLPNDPVTNDEIEEILGLIGGNASKAKNIILKKNQIKTRYYSLNKEGEIVYSNAEMTAKAIEKLFSKNMIPEELELLACGTSLPDQLMPCHASMVHGLLQSTGHLKIFSPSGVCASAMQGLAHCYLSIKAGESKNAICSGSELASPIFRSDFFNIEINKLAELQNKPRIAFEKDFLRFMLSDGAGAFLLKDEATPGINFKIDWVESFSFAHENPVCMYLGCDIDKNNNFLSWHDIPVEQWAETSLFSVKQDTLLVERCMPYGAKSILLAAKKHPIDFSSIDYFVPHISSMYFYDKLATAFREQNVNIKDDAWYVPLPNIGNIGSATIFVSLDMLQKEKELKDGQKIMLWIPESSRFNFYYILLTVEMRG